MQNSGESEYSDGKSSPKELKLNFWQSFTLTLAGAAGLISLVADGPVWISITGFALVVVLAAWIAVSQLRKPRKQELKTHIYE